MQNEISVGKRLLFITISIILAFLVGYFLFTGGVFG
jgi:uncharacterized membrane protein YwzB